MTFIKKTARDLYIEREEAELEELEKQYREAGGSVDPAKTPVQVKSQDDNTPPVEDTLSEEEATWKKRYGDLRAYNEKIKTDNANELKALKAELEAEKRKATQLPENLEEAREWVEKYPDLARVIKTLIQEDLQIAEEHNVARFKELEEERTQLAKEKAINQILKSHPDFLELVQDDNFKDWVERQPEERGHIVGQALYDALYKNETDAQAAIKAVDIYKQDTGAKSKPKKNEALESARSVGRTNPPAPAPTGSGKRVYKESEIDAMSIYEYEKLEDDIDQARYEGRIVYDIRGAAM